MQSFGPKNDNFKVLVGIDFSTAGEGVLRRAITLACGKPSEVHVLNVAPAATGSRPPEPKPETLARLQELVRGELARLPTGDPPSGIQRVVTHVLTGSPAKEIVWLAAHLEADLIVVGTHARNGVQRLVLGSVAEKVLHTAGCPVLIDRPKHHDHRDDVPEIEPPCPDCLARRSETADKEMWCEHHSHALRTHVYSWADNSSGSMRPWGFSTS